MRKYEIFGLLLLSANLYLAGKSGPVSVEASLQPKRVQAGSAPLQERSDREGATSFKLVKTLDGKLSDGSWFKVFEIAVSNGHSLYLQRDLFSSAKRANEEMREYCAHAQKITRRNPELDVNGRVVGERVLAPFPRIEGARPPESEPHYILFWTSGADFYAIVARQQEDVLALENWFKQNSFRDLLKD